MQAAENCRGGWKKLPGSPVLGGDLGTCFDISVVEQEGVYKMYFSWRPVQCIAMAESRDGIHWSEPVKVLLPRATAQGWEDDLNRPGVLYKDGIYHMWYTGQYKPGKPDGTSHIFYAVSTDGIHFSRKTVEPVLCPELLWEKDAVMCPHVIWEGDTYKMWYSGGEQYEPNALGYAESTDGLHWIKHPDNPIFQADPASAWEQHKVTACQVIRQENGYTMLYIGFFNEDYAQIGLAHSDDGIHKWRRYPQNPIIAPTPGSWDADACYKPFALPKNNGWILWYNGRRGGMEQIGAAYKAGDLW